jgi:hypothetical protein
MSVPASTLPDMKIELADVDPDVIEVIIVFGGGLEADVSAGCSPSVAALSLRRGRGRL